MPAPNSSTFDMSPPQRPGKEHFNDISKEDDTNEPPDPNTQPNAAEWNTIEFTLLSVGRVVPTVVISIVGGDPPSLASFTAAPKATVTGSFNITRTGAGNVLIEWPANMFPPSVARPVASLNAGPGMIHAVMEGDGVRVHTYNSAGAATDLSFTVEVR